MDEQLNLLDGYIVEVQCIQKVFKLFQFFHILLGCSLML